MEQVVPHALLRRIQDCSVTGILDLSDWAFLNPVDLVTAAAYAHSAGEGITVTGPAAAEPSRYASRMHLARVLDNLKVSHDLTPVKRESNQQEHLLEVSRVTCSADALALAELVEAKLSSDNPLAADALYQGLTELGANVPEHSGSIGFMAAQTFQKLQVVRFAVVDAGVGLLSTLSRKGAASDQDAVIAALAGTSRWDDPSRGTGISSTHRQLSELKGQSVLLSGGAAVVSNARGQHQRTNHNFWQGTLFAASFPVDPP